MRKVMLVSLLCSLLVAAGPIQGQAAGLRAAPQDLEAPAPIAPREPEPSSPPPPQAAAESEGMGDEPESVASPAQASGLGHWRNFNPTTNYLLSLSMLPSGLVRKGDDCPRPSEAGPCQEGWIVGSDGLILGYANGVWEQVSTPTSNRLRGVHAVSATLGLGVGKEGTILTYDWDPAAGGTGDYTWSRYPIPAFGGSLRAVHAITTTTGAHALVGWAVGEDGALVQGWADAEDAGDRGRYNFTWQDVEPFEPRRDFWDVHIVSPTEAWAIGGESETSDHGTILHYDGSSWSVYQDDPDWGHLSGLHMFPEGDEGWAVGYGGTILHYENGTWSRFPSPTTAILRDVAMTSRTEGWAVGAYGLLLRYENGAWRLFSRRLTDPFHMFGVDARGETVWAIGPDQSWSYGSVIMKHVPADDAWIAITSPTINHLNEVDVLAENDAWAVGNEDRGGTVDALYGKDALGATVLHWNGAYWARIFQTDPPLPKADLLALDMVSEDEGWAMGEAVRPSSPGSSPSPASTILSWDGYRWAPPPLQSPINVDIKDVSMLHSDYGWAGGAGDRAVVRYSGDYWEGFAACNNYTYDLNGVSLVTDTTDHPWGAWYGWAVGHNLTIPGTPHGFTRFGDCSGVNRWVWDSRSANCRGEPDGSSRLNSVDMVASDRGWAVGTSSSTRAQVYTYTVSGWKPWNWGYSRDPYCHTANCAPSGINDVFALDDPNLAWFSGFWSCDWDNRQSAFILHYDPEKLTGDIGRAQILPEPSFAGVFHQPINAISAYTSTFLFAVGQAGHIYHYPYPNYLLNLQPEEQVVKPGNVATSTVSATSIGGVSPVITLSVQSALPPATEATFSRAAIEPGLDATLRITTSAATPTDVYSIIVGGRSTFRSGDTVMTVTRRAELRLHVTNNPVYHVSPDHGPAGTLVTIMGEGFGSDPGPGQRSTDAGHVRFAGVQLPDSAIESWSDTAITFRPPDDVALWNGPVQGAVVVRADGSDSNDNHTFKLEPYISHLEPEYGSPGTEIEIHGTTFGSDPGYSMRDSVHYHVTLGDTVLGREYVNTWSNNLIIITVPESPASGNIVVTSNAFDSNAVELSSAKVYLPLVLRSD